MRARLFARAAALLALQHAAIGYPPEASAQGVCGVDSTPFVTFPTAFTASGPGRIIPVHTRSPDVYREWAWNCDDPEDEFPLTMNCEVWDTCTLSGPCSSDVVTPSPAVTQLASPMGPTSGPPPPGNCEPATEEGDVTGIFDVAPADYLPDHRYFYTGRCEDDAIGGSGNVCAQSRFWWYDTTSPVPDFEPPLPLDPTPVDETTGLASVSFEISCMDNSQFYDFFGLFVPRCTLMTCSLFYHPTDPASVALVSSDSCGGFPELAVDGGETAPYALQDLQPGFYSLGVVAVDSAVDLQASGAVLPGNQSAQVLFAWEVRGLPAAPVPMLSPIGLFVVGGGVLLAAGFAIARRARE